MLREKIRTLLSFHLALISILGLWVYMVANQDVGDPDLWFHLKNAEYIVRNFSFPQVDTYSFTAGGQPLIDHQWLAELAYYLAWRLGGLVGVYVMYISLIEVILLGVFYLAYTTSGNLKGSFLVSCFSVLLAAVSFGPRTLLFGYIYLLIVLLILWRFRSTGQAPLWVLPPLFCLWINTHGSWISGMIVLGIIVASGLVEGSVGQIRAVRWSREQLKRLLIVGGASVAALFVNPYGYRLVFYPFDLAFRQKLNVGHVEEWASINFHEPRGKIVFILLVALLVAALLGKCRWRLDELGLALFALYFGLVHVRFLFQAAILLAPLLAKALDFLPPYRKEIDKPLLNSVVVAGVLLVMIFRFPTQAELAQAVGRRYPVDAITYVRSHGLSGPVFNLYIWGGYLAWCCPQVKTFIDSRADIFEYVGVFQDYLDAITLKDSLAVLDKHRIRYVLMPPRVPLTYLLKHNPGWKVVFDDEVTTILERVEPAETAATPGRGSSTGANP